MPQARWFWAVARFSTPIQTGPGPHPTSCTMGAGSLFGGKAVALTAYPHLLPRFKK